MGSTMQITEAIQPLDSESQRVEQPLDQQAVVVMTRNMFQLMLVFGFIEGLVLNLPATFGHAEQGACADLLGR